MFFGISQEAAVGSENRPSATERESSFQDLLLEEPFDAGGDFFPVRFERKVTRVEEMGFHIL